MGKTIRKEIKIDTEFGLGVLDSIEVTELGYLKVKLFYPERKVWHSFISNDGLQDVLESVRLKQSSEINV